MTVKELMTTNVCFVKSDAPISDAIDLIKRYDIGIIPVCDNKGCLLGIITDRDIVLRGFPTEPWTFSAVTVSDIMTTEVYSISPEMNVHDAAYFFSTKKVRRLPVLDNARLVGVLSISDLAKKKIFLAEVGDIMGSLSQK